MLYEPPNASVISVGENWASSMGFDPNAMGSSISSSMPLSNLSDPALHNQIMQLPNTQALANLVACSDSVVASVTVANNGFGSYYNPQQL